MEDLLMQRVASGDHESFNELYRLWSRRVMSYAYTALRSVEDARDVVQETFVQLYKSAPTYRAEGKFAAFVMRIAGNQVRMHFRARRPVSSLSDIEDEEAETPESLRYDPEARILDGIDIDSLLSALPPRQHEALVLVGSGVSYAEGARMLEISQEAFAQLVLRGRRALRDKLKKRYADKEE